MRRVSVATACDECWGLSAGSGRRGGLRWRNDAERSARWKCEYTRDVGMLWSVLWESFMMSCRKLPTPGRQPDAPAGGERRGGSSRQDDHPRETLRPRPLRQLLRIGCHAAWHGGAPEVDGHKVDDVRMSRRPNSPQTQAEQNDSSDARHGGLRQRLGHAWRCAGCSLIPAPPTATALSRLPPGWPAMTGERCSTCSRTLGPAPQHTETHRMGAVRSGPCAGPQPPAKRHS